MKPEDRIYNSATDKQWSSEVYHKAQEVIEQTLSVANIAVQFNSICEATKRQYPSLCDDSIKDPSNPQWPYWKHLVGSAISRLKKQGKVAKADNGWIWVGGKPPPDEPGELARQIRDLLEELLKLAKKGKEGPPRLTHDELVGKIREMGEMLGKIAEGPWGPVYKHDCVWKDNPYANPRLVWEVCDRGNLDKDIASLLFAVKSWGAKGILVLFEESDFRTAQKKLAQESQIYPLKAEDVLKLHSLLKAGNIQAVRSIFAV